MIRPSKELHATGFMNSSWVFRMVMVVIWKSHPHRDLNASFFCMELSNLLTFTVSHMLCSWLTLPSAPNADGTGSCS